VFRHRFGDLVVGSEIELSQLPSADDATPECVVTFQRPLTLVDPAWDHLWRRPDGSVSLSCAKDGDDYALGFPGWGRAFVRDEGREIEVLLEPGVPRETVEHLVCDQLLPRVAAFRGRLVLHAGCVVTAAGACAFLGGSGAGKSTLCARFVRDGDLLLGDDGIFVRRAGSGGFVAEATYPGLRLAPQPDLPDAGPVSHDSAKRRIPLGTAGAYPLRAIYLLDEPASAERAEAALLPPREGFVALLKSCFQLHLDDPARTRRLFEQLSELLDVVPLRVVRYARRLELLPAVRDEVLRDLAETMLRG
jgi:hypothetical protein